MTPTRILVSDIAVHVPSALTGIITPKVVFKIPGDAKAEATMTTSAVNVVISTASAATVRTGEPGDKVVNQGT